MQLRTVDGEMYNVTKYRLWLNIISKRQRADVERERVSSLHPPVILEACMLAGRVLGELYDRSDPWTQGCYFFSISFIHFAIYTTKEVACFLAIWGGGGLHTPRAWYY